MSGHKPLGNWPDFAPLLNFTASTDAHRDVSVKLAFPNLFSSLLGWIRIHVPTLTSIRVDSILTIARNVSVELNGQKHRMLTSLSLRGANGAAELDLLQLGDEVELLGNLSCLPAAPSAECSLRPNFGGEPLPRCWPASLPALRRPRPHRTLLSDHSLLMAPVRDRPD